jgi:hypothetical protein
MAIGLLVRTKYLLTHDGKGFFWWRRNVRAGEQAATLKIFLRKNLFFRLQQARRFTLQICHQSFL